MFVYHLTNDTYLDTEKCHGEFHFASANKAPIDIIRVFWFNTKKINALLDCIGTKKDIK
jgi:hypothetical protein